MNAIEIQNLSKKYKDFELKNINLSLPKGCIMGLVGENGSGKSTLIKLILDLIPRNEGKVLVLGKDNKEEGFEITKQDIGVVLDNMGLYPTFTGLKISKFMQEIYENWDNELFFEYLEKFKVSPKKKFVELSKGMKMKLGIAIALSHKAKLLILDEATNGLDPVIRDEILDILMDFTRDEDHSVFISSHITTDLEKICDYFAFLRNGELVLCEEKDRLLEEHCTVHCDSESFKKIPKEGVIGKKETPYGVDAMIKRSYLPEGAEFSNIDIEQLFVYMMKGEQDLESID